MPTFEIGVDVEARLISLGKKTFSRHVNKLDELCEGARSIEEIVAGWMRAGNSLIIGLNREMHEPCIAFSFVRRGETIAIANFTLDQMKRAYPAVDPLNEEVLPYSDQEGFRPNDEWFDSRNSRLGVYTDEDLDMNVAPPEALMELLLSYVYSSAGFAEISYQDGESANTNLLRASLVFLGLENDQGWYELIGFWQTALQDYIECRAALPH